MIGLAIFTEKIANVFEAGAIPIYWGDGDLARHFFNPEAFIDIKQYATFEAAADAVAQIAQNPQELERLLNAPLFKEDKIPPFLLINDDTLTDEEEIILQTMAQKLGTAYNQYLDQKKHLRPYWRALDLKLLMKEKIENLIKIFR